MQSFQRSPAGGLVSEMQLDNINQKEWNPYDRDNGEGRRHDVRDVRGSCQRCHPGRSAGEKITASHTKGQAVILSEAPLDEETLRAAIGKTGYEVQGISARPYEKKGLFGFLKK